MGGGWNLDVAVADYRERTRRSAELFSRARKHLPGGSTRTASFFEPYPAYLERGEGAVVWDVDGNRRIDFDANYGVLIHGQCFTPVVERIRAQAGTAHCFASPGPLEVDLAELIKARLPSIQLLRFTTSGTEAAALAIRAARAFTGREKIAKFAGGYHGSSEAVAVNTPGTDLAPDGRGGVLAQPDGPGVSSANAGQVIVLPFNDIDGVRGALAAHRDEVAAVIVEPVLGAAGLIRPRDGFLASLHELAARCGALLILDEVMMFRLGYHGAQGVFGVSPDLTLLGKVIGGGLPVGAVGGRADVMSAFDITATRAIRHSGTYNANPLTAAAGIATLEHLTPGRFARLRHLADRLVEGATRVLREAGVPASLAQAESMFNLHALPAPATTYAEIRRQDRALLKALHLGLLAAGIQITPTGMGSLSTVMDESHVDAFVEALRHAARRCLVSP
jgi:glutamate-1-semialdehyde 2,1-aminomutase